jgi:UDPglucose 6-dehydrogenase
MRIAVVGSGYVGLVAGACFADLGHEVILVDNDQQKLTALRNGEVPIHEKFLPELLSRHRGHRLTFSDDLKEAVRLSSAIFVAVGTPPTEKGDADLSYVESVAREISGGIDNYKVVIEKSTVPVYTSEWVRKIILRSGTDAESFDVASNPEFLREGTAVTDFLFPDRILIGCDSQRSADLLREIYAPLTDGSYYKRADAIPQPDRAAIPPALIITSTKSAELIKHASNAFLAMKISFINAVASVCESVGADVNQVVRGNSRTDS